MRTNLCLGPLTESESAFREVSDDQSIVTGYAVDSPGTNWLPPEHWLVWRLSRCVQRLRADDPELALGPDGKVVLVYDSEKNALSAFSASVQQKIGGSEIDLHRAVRDAVGGELRECAGTIPGFRACLPEQFHVNGAGNFEVGGPEGDNGLSGKKLVVDAYGPRVPIGGGALSGKDFFKADRAGAILARRLARTVVAAGLAMECIATLAIFPGDLALRAGLKRRAPGPGATGRPDGSRTRCRGRTLRPDARSSSRCPSRTLHVSGPSMGGNTLLMWRVDRCELECLIAADLIASISARHSPASARQIRKVGVQAANAAREVNERRAEDRQHEVNPSPR